MPLNRVVIDWHQPALLSTAEYLIARYATRAQLDLHHLLVALPGGRAGRRLLEILVDQAAARHLALVPPRIVTVGQLPELLYDSERPHATTFTQQLAWVEALHTTDPAVLTRLAHDLPPPTDLLAWLAFGDLLATLHGELAGDGLTFADVAARGPTLPSFRESERWHALATLQASYLQVLDTLGMWDPYTARLWAITQRVCRTDCDILLVGTVDLNLTQRAMLDQVADRVTALLFTPAELAERLDAHGRVVTQAWQDSRIDLDAVDVMLVDRPNDQADAVVDALARYHGRFAADDVTLGVPDTTLLPYIQQRLDAHELPCRYGPGGALLHTEPCRLLKAMAEFLEQESFAAFANLARHPAIDRWLTTQGISGAWLMELDDYYCEHLPARMTGHWSDTHQPHHLLHRAFAALAELLQPFRGESRQPHQWADTITGLLLQVYGHTALDTVVEGQRSILEACESIHQAVHDQLEVHASLAPAVTGAAALRLTLHSLGGVTMPPRFDSAAIELLGWLELPLDDAPALIVTGFNEGYVPASQTGALFLPDALRSHLGLQDNARRYARDAYFLTMLAASHRHLTLIAGRRTPDNDPMLPSRLLFAGHDEAVVSRTLDAFVRRDHADHRQPLRSTRLTPGAARSHFTIPPPMPLPSPVSFMRVTEFRDYLACPYRYYLKHRLGLQSVDTTASELGGREFGILIHDVLQDFATGPAVKAQRADTIREALYSTLDALVRQVYGEEPLPAICLQAEQARGRLDKFADWQADWSRQGWRIAEVERHVGGQDAWLMVDGMPMYLRGRIDRIDVHERTGTRVIFDYKTGDMPSEPDKAHRSRQGEWHDLQLPLYRHLVPERGSDGPSQLGYILLPRTLQDTGACIAPWSPADLEQADQVAADVVRQVRAEKFWPPSELGLLDDFAVICQTEQLRTHPDA
jgi:hypothetical protein